MPANGSSNEVSFQKKERGKKVLNIIVSGESVNHFPYFFITFFKRGMIYWENSNVCIGEEKKKG